MSSSSPSTSSTTQPSSRVTSARRMLVTTGKRRPIAWITGSVTSSGLKLSLPRRLATGTRLQAAGDGGDDRQVVVLADGGVETLAEADVGVVEVDVDELAELAGAVVETVVEARELDLEVLERQRHGRALHLDLRASVGQAAKWPWDADGDCHGCVLSCSARCWRVYRAPRRAPPRAQWAGVAAGGPPAGAGAPAVGLAGGGVAAGVPGPPGGLAALPGVLAPRPTTPAVRRLIMVRKVSSR